MQGSNRGYIAVTSAIIIAVLMLTIAGIVSFSSYMSRFNAFDAASKERSRAFAEACADRALLNIAQNPSYGGNETVALTASESCNILPVENQGAQKIIKTTAAVEGIVSDIRVAVTLSPLTIVSWEEVPVF